MSRGNIKSGLKVNSTVSLKFEAVIGLEVHAQLKTKTKIFCGCSTEFGNPPNTNTCPICLGHPGVLPVLNKKVVEFAVKLGLATNCTVNKTSEFARKNYFYPDLPKGYQISQFDKPICENGFLEVYNPSNNKKKIRIKRIHMEEDAGKLIHDVGDYTLFDANRCGVPLLEIVTEPDIATASEAVQYLNKIKQIVQYLDVCDGNMEEGSLRCDANISLRLRGSATLGVKTEIKNMNSFKNVERAIEFEIQRQTEILEEGRVVIQETLLWNADLEEATSMRGKEEAHDYRYFPEPDLMPLLLSNDFISEIKNELVELPDTKIERFIRQYSLPKYDAEILTQSKNLANFFEAVSSATSEYKLASNWVMVETMKILNERKIEIELFPIPPKNLGELINRISDGTISNKIAKEIFDELLEANTGVDEIIEKKNLKQISNADEINKIIAEILEKNPQQVQQFKEGSEKVFGFFVGQIMKATNGKANPHVVTKLLRDKLS